MGHRGEIPHGPAVSPEADTKRGVRASSSHEHTGTVPVSYIYMKSQHLSLHACICQSSDRLHVPSSVQLGPARPPQGPSDGAGCRLAVLSPSMPQGRGKNGPGEFVGWSQYVRGMGNGILSGPFKTSLQTGHSCHRGRHRI